MYSSDFNVIVHYRQRNQNFVEKFLTTMSGLPFRQFNSHLKLRHSDGGDCYVVLVSNHLVKIGVGPFRID